MSVNRYYDKGSAEAYVMVGEKRYEPEKIRRSPYVTIGLAVEFTDECRDAIEISPTRFTLHFSVNNPHMVYVNEQRDGTVGIRFRPTWFNPNYQDGSTTRLEVRVILPEGHTLLTSTYPLEDRPWDDIHYTDDGRIMAVWEDTNVHPLDQERGVYDIGVAFPEKHVDEYFEQGALERTGNVLYSIGHICWITLPLSLIAFAFALFVISTMIENKYRRKNYLDPELCVVGAGPRRDLTAVEAAVVLETPLDRVAAMILFGLIRKRKVTLIEGGDPLELEKHYEEGDHPYETRFLRSIKGEGHVSRTSLKSNLIELVNEVEAKLEGFDLEETRTYYTAIVKKAWKQMEKAGSPEKFSLTLKEQEEWLMMVKDPEDRFETVYIHHHGHDGKGHPDVRNMAQRYVARIDVASNQLASDMRSLTGQVNEVTHPPPVSSGGGGSGGGGCACACACACAGGGR
jgi:hypothetical protein